MDLTTSYNLINAQANANNAWSAAQAQKQMDFQKYMSDTAHQREVADLKAAGLNPVLSSGGSGASTPSGAMGSTDTGNTAALMNLLEKSLDAQNNSARAVISKPGVNPDSDEIVNDDDTDLGEEYQNEVLDFVEGVAGKRTRKALEALFGAWETTSKYVERKLGADDAAHNPSTNDHTGHYETYTGEDGKIHRRYVKDKEAELEYRRAKNKALLQRIGNFFRTNAQNSAKAVDAYLGQG